MTSLSLPTLRLPRPRPVARLLGGRADVLTVAIAVVTAAVFGYYTTSDLLIRAVLTAAALVFAFALAVRAPLGLLYLALVWLPGLGLVRRALDASTGQPTQDPLLLISPVIVILLAAHAARRGAFSNPTTLSVAVTTLGFLMLLEAFNPAQGSLYVGITALLFTLVPLLWFYVGRAFLSDDNLVLVLGFLAVLAVASGVYGLVQTYAGFTSFDNAWVSAQLKNGYYSLQVNGVIRAFGSFSSASEYAYYIGIGLAIWWSILLATRFRKWIALAVIAMLGWAILVESSRTIVILLGLAFAASIAARRRARLPTTILVGLLAIWGVGAIAGHYAAGTPNLRRTTGITTLLLHQAQGLANPTNDATSSLLRHVGLVQSGLVDGLKSVVGYGIGAISLSAQKYGGHVFATELDPSNAAVAMGVPGFLAYIGLVVAAFRRAFRVARMRRDFVGIATLTVLMVTGLQWLNGGQYAVAPIPWLLLGWLDRQPWRTGQEAELAELT